MARDRIRQYWEEQGRAHGESHWASWGDNWAIELEIETIAKHIHDGDHVLDIGCANGYSTFRQYESHRLGSITGVDFAASMVAAAVKTKSKKNLGPAVTFAEG